MLTQPDHSSLGFISPWILLTFGVLLLIFMEFGNQLERMYKADNGYAQNVTHTPRPRCIGTDTRDCFDTDEGLGFNE